MTCAPDSIQCSLEQLGRTLTSFNANDFLATALATLVGVVAGALLTILLNRVEARSARKLRDEEAIARESERKEQADEQRQVRLEAALDRLIWATNDYVLKLRRLWEQQQAVDPEPEWSPQDWPILAAIASARMISSGEDEINILNEIRELVLGVRLTEPKRRAESLAQIWRFLILWRSGRPISQVLEEIRDLRNASEPS